jgi:Flp pilus assembly secretin CpaC
VPGLANLPILGRLFQSRSTQKSTDELLVVITPHFVRPLTPEEKANLPDMPATFLPTVVQEKAKKGKGKGKTAASTPPDQPEFVGPRGQQIPK